MSIFNKSRDFLKERTTLDYMLSLGFVGGISTEHSDYPAFVYEGQGLALELDPWSDLKLFNRKAGEFIQVYAVDKGDLVSLVDFCGDKLSK